MDRRAATRCPIPAHTSGADRPPGGSDDQVPVIAPGEPLRLGLAAVVHAQLVEQVRAVSGPVACHPAMLARPPPAQRTVTTCRAWCGGPRMGLSSSIYKSVAFVIAKVGSLLFVSVNLVCMNHDTY